MHHDPSTYQLISIVLPCYNPPSGWDQIVIDELKYIGHLYPAHPLELIIVNDGSTTDEENALSRCQSSIESCTIITLTENQGKGHALRLGVAEATGEVIIYSDIDFPYERLSTIKVISALLEEEIDVAIGQRDSAYYKSIPLQRKIISKLLQAMIKTTLKLKTSDTQGGLKGFNQKGKEIFLETKIDRYLFDLEFVKLISQDPSISTGLIPVTPKQDIQMKPMAFTQLWQSAKDFISLVCHS